MRSVGRMIRARRASLGLTVRALAEAVGCTRTYLSQIENGRRSAPPSEALLRKLERNLRMEAGTLVSAARWQSSPAEVKREVRSLRADRAEARKVAKLLQDKGIDALHASGELARLVDRLSEERSSSGDVQRVEMGGRVPIINRMRAGPFAEFTDLGYPARVADEYISVPGLSDPDAFAARVQGDSMEPTYSEGDIVVFSPLTQVRDGSDCFVRMDRDGESTFKRVHFQDDPDSGEKDEAGLRIRLTPLNERYPSRVVDRESVAGMYPAVYVMRAVGGG